MTLENYESISSEEKLAEELGSAIEGFKIEEGKVAKDAIKNLNAEKLTKFIEKTFNDGGAWSTYSEMRQNKFYPFMVQASIDLLSDTLGDKKYNENGEEDNNGKTLDEYIKECGGIDNQYGPGTKHIVGIVQKILGIHYDMAAGPQFFAKICSVLKGESNVSNFKVKNKNNYKYNFDNGGDNQVNVGYESYQLEGVTLRYNKNKITIENKNDGPYIKYNGKSVKIKIGPFFKTPTAEGFKFIKNQDSSYTIRAEGEDNFKDSKDVADKTIKYNENEIEVRSNAGFIQFRRKGDNYPRQTLTPEGNGYKAIDGFVIKVTDDGTINIRLNNKSETLGNERKEQEEFLNSININNYPHKIAYKINNERNYCSYNSNYFATYNKEKGIGNYNHNGKIRDIYNYINIIGDNDCNLADQSYEGIKNINSSSTDAPSTKRWYIKNYTSKGKRIKGNQETLYDRCVKKAANNGKGKNGGDFVVFGQKMEKLGVQKSKITFGVWTSMLKILGDKSIDSIQNIAII